MRTRRAILVALMLAIVAAAAVHANEERPFTAEEIDKFLEDWPRFNTWAIQQGQRIDSAPDPTMLMRMLPGMQPGAFLRTAGWTVERFSYVAGHTWMAIITLETEAAAPAMVADIDAAIEEIRANPAMTAAQKRPAIEQLEGAKAMMLGLTSYFSVDPVELELVRERADRVREVLGLE